MELCADSTRGGQTRGGNSYFPGRQECPISTYTCRKGSLTILFHL